MDLIAFFGRLGDLIKDLVKAKKIKDEHLLQQFAVFINRIISINDAEMDNVIKCGIFSMLDPEDYLVLKKYLSDSAYDMMTSMYKSS